MRSSRSPPWQMSSARNERRTGRKTAPCFPSCATRSRSRRSSNVRPRADLLKQSTFSCPGSRPACRSCHPPQILELGHDVGQSARIELESTGDAEVHTFPAVADEGMTNQDELHQEMTGPVHGRDGQAEVWVNRKIRPSSPR